VLDELLRRRLHLVVCGTAAGTRSAPRRQYYAGPGNKFWQTLAAVGLTDRVLQPAEYKQLLAYGIGLTDLVKGQAGSDSRIRFERAARLQLHATIMLYQPRYFCFNGKRPAREFLADADVPFGVQRQRIGRTALFVAPSTSGAAGATWDVSVWQDLARRVLRGRAAA
jgi:TDG/mug DNA glycosylase family protein